MRPSRRDWHALIRVLLIAVLFVMPVLVLADGGTVRISQQQGNYRITVFTSPNPVRAGPVDVSVFVQDQATLQPDLNVLVTIKARRRGSDAPALVHPATSETATNKLYLAANFDLPEPGWYTLEVSVSGALGDAKVGFELEADEPAPASWVLWPWIAAPMVPVVLFGLHQFLKRRSSR